MSAKIVREEGSSSVLERSVAEKSCRKRVLEKSVGEDCWRRVLE